MLLTRLLSNMNTVTSKEHPQRVRDMKRLDISLFCLKKIQYNNKKHTQKIKTNKQYAKNNKKAHENIHSQKVNVGKLYKKASCEIRTHANIRGSMTEVVRVSTALLFLFV